MNRLLTAKELAQHLGVPVSFIYDRTRRNSPDPIPHIKLSKYVRFDLVEIDKWIEARRRPAPGPGCKTAVRGTARHTQVPDSVGAVRS